MRGYKEAVEIFCASGEILCWNRASQEAERGESSDAAVRVSAARQDNIVTRLKEEFVSLLKNMYFRLLVCKRWVCEYFFLGLYYCLL